MPALLGFRILVDFFRSYCRRRRDHNLNILFSIDNFPTFEGGSCRKITCSFVFALHAQYVLAQVAFVNPRGVADGKSLINSIPKLLEGHGMRQVCR